MGPKSAPNPDVAKPKVPGAVHANRHKPIPIDFGPVSVCFDHDPKHVNCEKAQPNKLKSCRSVSKEKTRFQNKE